MSAAVPPPIPPPVPKQRSAVSPRSPSVNLMEIFFRVAICVLLLASMTLAWWCFERVLVPIQQQTRQLTTTTARLSSEIDEMERRWNPVDAAQVSNKFAQVKSKLFADQPALESWLTTLRQQSVPLALEVAADIGSAVPKATNNPNVAVIPTVISIDVQPSREIKGAESAYQRVLRLTQQLVAEEKRADLLELNVVSGTNSIERATMRFELWAGEEAAP